MTSRSSGDVSVRSFAMSKNSSARQKFVELNDLRIRERRQTEESKKKNQFCKEVLIVNSCFSCKKVYNEIKFTQQAHTVILRKMPENSEQFSPLAFVNVEYLK